MTMIALSMYFDEDTYFDEYPDLTDSEKLLMMKGDFIDTIQKQWEYEELIEALMVIED